MTWPMVKLETLVQKVSSWNPSTSVEDIDFLYIDLSSVDKNQKKINAKDVKNISAAMAPSRARQLVKENDVLIATVRPNLNGVALVTADFDGATASTGYCVLRANKNKLDERYLFYWVQSVHFIRDMISKATGANYPAVSDKIIFDSKIPLPPLAEQKRIAAILDKADAIRQKRQQAIALADDFLRSAFLDMFGDPVTNPKGWEVIKLGSCCRFQGGFAFKSEDYCDSGIPLVKITNVHFENIDWSDVSYVPADFLDTKAEFALKDEDLVMAMTRPIIKSLNAVKVIEVKEMDLPCLLNQRVGRFIDYENSFKKHFLKYLLYSDFFMNKVEKLCSVALQPNISAKQIEAITCYIPPIELQDEFSQIAKQIEQTIPHMSSFNDLDLFGSLNSKAFSGQL
ncbi:restriction endonuclease subunit S [Aeromonas hydrophila]